jgi:FAD/FMN-containing dehydrogenase
MRKHGMTMDSLLSARMILADASVVNVSPTENTDLFWGIRGGGGQLGVVIEIVLQLHQIGDKDGSLRKTC